MHRRHPHLGSAAVPASRRATAPAPSSTCSPAYPDRCPRTPAPHRRPRLRPRQRHRPPRRPLAHRAHHRLRQLARDARPAPNGLRRAHPGRRPPRLRRRGRRALGAREPYDLIVSNAALQWVPGPPRLLPRLDRRPRPRRHLRLPGPRQLRRAQPRPAARTRPTPPAGGTASAERSATTTRSTSPPTTSPALTDLGCEADVWETTYLHLLARARTRCWTGSRARPCARSSPSWDDRRRRPFVAEYRDLLRKAYPPAPHGTVFPFRRIFAVARKADA